MSLQVQRYIYPPHTVKKPGSLPLMISVALLLTVNTQLWGQSLAPTQWYRIRACYVDIIFKGNISREAQRMANTLEHLYEPVYQSLGVKPARISLILRNQSTGCLSFFTLMPRKMEFATFPPQDYNFIGTNDWLSLLAVHELRHVAQSAKSQQNFNQLVYWLGGDSFLAGISMLNIPKWFWEGDAVGIETVLTQSGRGRMSGFSRLYRANLLACGGFGYYTQRFGSFKDKISDEYAIGYYLTTYLRRKYGPSALANIFQRTTRPGLFHTTIKKITGKSLPKIYKEANQELKTLWQAQLSGLRITPATRLNTRNNADYTDYSFPQLGKDGEVIVLKSGIAMVPQFVSIDGKQCTRKVRTPGMIDVNIGFSIAQNKMIWVETIPDLIWDHCSYRVIQHYDIQAKRLKTLTKKSRYGAAALSPDATQIVAFESDEGYNHQLVILDAETGQVLQRLPNPENHYYLTPQWSKEGKHIVVVKNVQCKATLVLIDVATGTTQDLLPYTTAHLGCPMVQGQYVLYNSNYSGIDNIYAIDLATSQQYQVTSREYGAYNPIISEDGCWLIFNDFTQEGMDVAKMPFEPKQWIPLAQVEDRSVHYHAPLVEQEGNSDVLEYVPNHTYPIQRYQPQEHWLNVHSWLSIEDVNWNSEDFQHPIDVLRKVKLKVLQSKDLLGTTELEIDYVHDFKAKYGITSAKLTYQDQYPIISLSGILMGNYQKKMEYHRMLSLQLKAPWTLRYGQYTYQPSIYTTATLHKHPHTTWYTQTYTGSISRHSKFSSRDLDYPWQQKLIIQCAHTPYGGNKPLLRSTAILNAFLYFPGFAKHHTFQLSGSYEYVRDTPNVPFFRKNLGTYARDTPLEIKVQTYKQKSSAHVMYAFPLGYPDWSGGYLLYLKRVHAEIGCRLRCASMIYDTKYMIISSTHNTHGDRNAPQYFGQKRIKDATQYKSEIYAILFASCHLFTLFNLPMFSLGVRYDYKIEQRKGEFSFVCKMMVEA
jgi:hypothetical protein